MKWDNDEKTWETVHIMRKDDPLCLVQYANDNNLTNTNGWKWAKKYRRYTKKYVKLTPRVHNLNPRRKRPGTSSSLGCKSMTIPSMPTFWTS